MARPRVCGREEDKSLDFRSTCCLEASWLRGLVLWKTSFSLCMAEEGGKFEKGERIGQM